MKFSKLFLGITLSTATLGAAVGGAFALNNSGEKAQSADAAGSVPSGVYVDISACQWNTWGAGLSNIKAHIFSDSKEYTTWPGSAVDTATVNGTTYGYISIPSGATKVIFNAWDGGSNQNQTDDLTIPTDGKLLFKVTSYNTSSVQTGSWTNLDRVVTTSSQGVSNSTARLFYNHKDSAWDSDGADAVRAWGGSAGTYSSRPVSATLYILKWFQDNDSATIWYAYADIPTNITGFQFVHTSGDTASSSIWNYQKGDSFTLSSDTFTSMYFAYNDGDGKANVCISKSDGGAKGSDLGATFFSNLIPAYDTCSDSVYNGYGAGTSLRDGWYAKSTAAAKTTLVTSRGGVSKTVQEHIEGMARRPGSLPGSNAIVAFNSGNITTILVVIGIASIATLSVGYFYFKKKRNI